MSIKDAPPAGLPFTYMRPEETRLACGFGSINSMQRATRDGKFIEPDYFNGRAKYRSDKVAEWLLAQAREADEQRETRRRAAEDKGKRMHAHRGGEVSA